MKSLFALIVAMLLLSTADAQSLISKADRLKPRYTFYGWATKERIYLTDLGSLERRFPSLVFLRVNTNMSTGVTIIEGFTNDSGLKEDSFGLCCFNVLVAQIDKNEELSNIRQFGKTLLASDSSNTSGRDGFFRCEIKLKRKDVLLVGNVGAVYWGAVLVPIGELLSR